MKTYNQYTKSGNKKLFDAVWQYLLDHAELTHDGTLFVKFHCKDKMTFARRIYARTKGIHRTDPVWAETILKERRDQVLEHSRMQSALAEVKKTNEQRNKSLWKRFLKV